MKKSLIILLSSAALFVSCNREEDGPTKKDKNMILEEMTWHLDSILVIHNYQTPNEESYVLHESDRIYTWSYTFYPWKYKFPKDLCYSNMMSGEAISMADEYPENFCKYICTGEDGNFLSGGYVKYYKDNMFMLSGTKSNGMVEVRIAEDYGHDWDAPVWTFTYNPIEEDDGTITERHVEYYSRVK